MAASRAAGPVGVGLLLNPSLERFVQDPPAILDYLALIPDRAWIDHGVGTAARFERLPLADELVDTAARCGPAPLHAIGLSIGSATLFDAEYATQLVATQRRLGSPWVSEHLSFSRLSSGHELNAAVALPLPYDQAVLDLLVPRVRWLVDRLECPFLLENSVAYVDYPGQELGEARFLATLCERTGCGLLLDLHNLYCNAVNLGFEARDYLWALDLRHVQEIHVAGGVPLLGLHTDSHTGAVIEPVWKLLDEVLPRTPHLRGVTFEFHESSFGLLGDSGVRLQLERIRDALRRAGCAAGAPGAAALARR